MRCFSSKTSLLDVVLDVFNAMSSTQTFRVVTSLSYRCKMVRWWKNIQTQPADLAKISTGLQWTAAVCQAVCETVFSSPVFACPGVLSWAVEWRSWARSWTRSRRWTAAWEPIRLSCSRSWWRRSAKEKRTVSDEGVTRRFLVETPNSTAQRGACCYLHIYHDAAECFRHLAPPFLNVS